MHYLVDMLANSLEAIVFLLGGMRCFSPSSDKELKCYLKTQNLELPGDCEMDPGGRGLPMNLH